MRTAPFSWMIFTLPLLAIAGCVKAVDREDYSPGYSYVATAGGGSGKGADGSVLVPDACLGEPADNHPLPADTRLTVIPDVGPHLPPGCANAYNLQRMAERQRDLVEGRHMGAAPGAPTARAARRYIHGDEQPFGPPTPPPQETEVAPAPAN
jgi:hypothetical protein